eukprot:749938-Hanusia_phi.AAC.3
MGLLQSYSFTMPKSQIYSMQYMSCSIIQHCRPGHVEFYVSLMKQPRCHPTSDEVPVSSDFRT